MKKKAPDGLHIVKPGKVLHWPLEVIRHMPVPDRYKRRERGYHREVHRRGVVRGTGADEYVVDLSDPLERVLCRGQEGRLMPLVDAEGGRNRPRRATKIVCEAYDAWVAELNQPGRKRLSSRERDPEELTPAEKRAMDSAKRRAAEGEGEEPTDGEGESKGKSKPKPKAPAAATADADPAATAATGDDQ